MTSLPKTFKAARATGPKQPWEIVELPIREPGPNEVLVRVHAAGICASDTWLKEGHWPGVQYPRIPGHEVVGRIAAIGSNLGSIERFKIGALIGVGWSGGYCGTCEYCRIGEFWTCKTGAVTGFTHDGGQAEYMYAPESAVVTIPEEALKTATYAELAPLVCAGVTVFDAIRTSKWSPGDICLVQGIGGLGHLAIQYASKMGLKVYAVSSGNSKRDLTLSLGAHGYFDGSTTDVVAEMQALGGARLIVCTAPYADQISGIIPAVSKNGTVMVVAAATDKEIKYSSLVANLNRATIRGWCCGASPDSEQCIKFSTISGIKSIVQEYSLEQYAEAYDAVVANESKFRNVIVFP